MIGIDSTFLVDLYWNDSPRHESAVNLFNKVASEPQTKLYVYFNCFNDFLHIITDENRFDNAMSMKDAFAIIEEWANLENVIFLYPDDFSFMRSKIWLSFYKLGRNRINDANMAACYAQNSISKIITAKPEDFEVFEIFTPISY